MGESDADSEPLAVPADHAPQQPRDPELLTVEETASTLGLSKMAVYRLVHSKVLPAIRTGPTFKVPEPAVQEYLRQAGAPANRG
ncbi:helix-turn-helix domain-containing protein [Streptomyces sp. NPDC002012]|uniref:helix-turn-helix domain-containing protein n=1 Tax=Streptomyces sp. NPDC002012 TaxID=3154532 RepID=UPI0033296FDF